MCSNENRRIQEFPYLPQSFQHEYGMGGSIGCCGIQTFSLLKVLCTGV